MPEKQFRSLERAARADLLCRLQAAQFAMHDLAIYLDTHPTDEQALSAFLAHRQAYEAAAAAYAKRFGALTMQQICEEDGWGAWSNTPFPWEKEAN